ncbi:hypothetical protein [Actinoplanes sp. NPDC051494]|uniref:hypothetical protein n=1 Tax=Actinoplanes sp. NPDC051494 TaxID=3363907 RepID=UPI00378F4855
MSFLLQPSLALPGYPGGEAAEPVAEVAVHGRWSRRLGLDVSAMVRDRLSRRPAAVIIDLYGLIDEDAASLPLWLAVRRAAAAVRPPIHVALCLPTTAALDRRLRRIGARRLPMFATMAQARAAMTDRACAVPGERGRV